LAGQAGKCFSGNWPGSTRRPPEADRDTQAWVPAVEEGIRQFLADQAQQGRRIVGTRVVLTRLADHPVDSRAGSFEHAAFRAMTQAFEAAAVPGELP
jgi:translation elongation factor EF-G